MEGKTEPHTCLAQKTELPGKGTTALPDRKQTLPVTDHICRGDDNLCRSIAGAGSPASGLCKQLEVLPTTLKNADSVDALQHGDVL